jgi:hypothetical protein
MKSLRINRGITLLSLTAILTVLLLIPSAWAKSTRYCVETEYEVLIAYDPDPIESKFVGKDDFHIWHLRGGGGEGRVTGDIETETYVFTDKTKINWHVGKAQGHGTQELIDACVDIEELEEPLCGGFKGSTNARLFQVDGWLWDYEYEFIAFGDGDFLGMKLFQTCTGDTFGNTENCIGFIFAPHGTIPDRVLTETGCEP